MATAAGLHSAFAFAPSLASHFALQSALICGGFISPVHLGAVIVAEQPPLHVPLHEAAALNLQLPPQLPLHRAPPTCASHLPSQVPLQDAPLDVLPSHLPLHLPLHEPFIWASHEPWQVPSHFAAALRSHEPVHCALHVPESFPGSHSTLASPGLMVASQ